MHVPSYHPRSTVQNRPGISGIYPIAQHAMAKHQPAGMLCACVRGARAGRSPRELPFRITVRSPPPSHLTYHRLPSLTMTPFTAYIHNARLPSWLLLSSLLTRFIRRDRAHVFICDRNQHHPAALRHATVRRATAQKRHHATCHGTSSSQPAYRRYITRHDNECKRSDKEHGINHPNDHVQPSRS